MLSFSTVAKPLALTAAAGLLITLSACSGGSEQAGSPAPVTVSPPASSAPADTTSPSAAPSSEAPTSSASSSPTRPAGNQALLDAGALALKEVSNGTVVSIESERNGWEVHVVTSNGGEQQVRTDLTGTKIVSGPTDDRPDADDRAENQQFDDVKVDYREAVKTIQGEIDGGQISELSLDSDDGRTMWEADVSITSEQRTVQVDADSGDVISNRVDD